MPSIKPMPAKLSLDGVDIELPREAFECAFFLIGDTQGTKKSGSLTIHFRDGVPVGVDSVTKKVYK